jgi:ribosomal protein L15, bacterial/organelle
MELSNLTPQKGSIKSKKKRIGRGQGSGKGGTATRGHKGAKSRSGYSKKLGFEGGQMPLQRRIPKFGFKNINRVEYQAVNLDALQLLIDNKKVKKKTIDINTLIENRLVGKNDLVKILGRGDLNSPITVEAHKFSETAKKAIEKAGGEIKTV